MQTTIRQSVKRLLESGHTVDFGRLTICDLGNFSATRKSLKRRYQVECTDARLRFSEIYETLELAVDKFCGIRAVLIAKMKEKANEKRDQ